MFFCNQILESHSWFGTLKIAAKCLDSCSVVEVKIPRQSKAFLSLNGNFNSDDMIMMMEVIIITKRNQKRKAGRKVKNLTSEESYKHRSDLLWSFSFLPDYICKDKASSQSNVIILSWHLELQEGGGGERSAVSPWPLRSLAGLSQGLMDCALWCITASSDANALPWLEGERFLLSTQFFATSSQLLSHR